MGVLALATGLSGTATLAEPVPGDEPRPGAARDRFEERSARPDEGRVRRKGERRRGGPPPGLWHRLSEEERAAIAAFVEERFPMMFLELERVRMRHPQRFERRMRRIAPEMREMMELMETHPERGALRIQERRLDIQKRHVASRYRSTDDPQKRERLREEFRRLCAESFDCRHQRRAIEIRELEARIKEFRQRHEEATRTRNRFIDREVRRRLGDPGGPRPDAAEHPDPEGGAQPEP
jgi:hypothetical protein